jgi:predicted transposase YdaD
VLATYDHENVKTSRREEGRKEGRQEERKKGTKAKA